MPTVSVRPLHMTDIPALLRFEIANRDWFESQIDPRAADFYSVPGITAHVEDYLRGFAEGTWQPLVLEEATQGIVGRANLKDIDSTRGCAEVGYRIDRHFCGQGLATLALRQLIHQARERWQLQHLLADVYKRNVGSSKVLERCGFVLEPPPAADPHTLDYRLVLGR